jgi:Cu2+-exporting ATPase
VFDKTGTLTLPEPRIANALSLDSRLLEIAARLALSSRHPLATAVAREARERVPFDGAIEETGRGVRAIVDGAEVRLGSAEFSGMIASAPVEPGTSTITFSHKGVCILLLVRQALRHDAAETAAALRALGLDLFVLSGDRKEAVEPPADELGIKDWQGALTPAQKIAAIEALHEQGRRVLMVGDGLNDAPALAAAHVSLSPITAADLTQAQADAVFLGEKLTPVRELIVIARRARMLMHQNLWLAVIYNAIAVPIAIAGLVTPLIAAVAMSGSSVLVTLNALRARTRQVKRRPASSSTVIVEAIQP